MVLLSFVGSEAFYAVIAILTIVISAIGLIIKIIKGHKEEMTKKLDAEIFRLHEESNCKEFSGINEEIKSVTTDITKQRDDSSEMWKILVRLDTNVEFIKEKIK